MRTLFIILFCAAVLSCNKTETEYKYKGTLTGYDLSLSPCSGGIYLETEGKKYHVEGLPGMSSADFYNMPLPKTIYFNGNEDSKCKVIDDGYFIITDYSF